VLHGLRDRLPTDEAAHLGAQLPMLVRGMYFEGWRPSGVRTERRLVDELGDRFRDEWHDDPADYARSVFKVLAKHVSAGEMDDVNRVVPEDVRRLLAPVCHGTDERR
jgi:uncharacterized protein (DUF2267 family)